MTLSSAAYMRGVIAGQTETIEAAKELAARDPAELGRVISDLGITDQAALVDIAKIAARTSCQATSHYIKNFGITDEAQLVEIAKVAAAQNGESLSISIKNYGITDQSALVEVAKCAAAQSGEGTSVFIKNYGITDQAALAQIAMIAAARNGEGTSKNIGNYGITDQAALAQIAEVAVAQNGWGTSLFIRSYGITDQAALVRIAKISAAEDGTGTSRHIQNYGITDQAALVDIAKITAAQDGSYTSLYIGTYGITDETALVQIAKIAASTNGTGTSRYIQNFGITDQSDLVDIATIAIAQNSYGTSLFIGQYGIKDQVALVRLAKSAAAVDGQCTSFSIKNFGITDEAELAQIAKISLTQSLLSIKWLSNYPLSEASLQSGVLVPFLREVTSGEHVQKYFTNFRDSFLKIVSDDFARQNLGIVHDDWSTLAPHQKLSVVAEWFSDLCKKYSDRDLPLASALEAQAEEAIFSALAATITCWDKAEVEQYGSRARATLAAFSGYDSIPKGVLSADACRELWGVVLTARDIVGPDLATKVPVNLSLHRPQALKILPLATALSGLGGELPPFNQPIDSTERFQAAEEILTQRVTQAFYTCLSISSSEDTDAVIRLWDQWGGDLLPFTVLAGRYRAQEHWKQELPILSEIARRCLDSSFHTWRYHRDDAQLSMLSDQQLAEWRENSCQISKIIAGADNEAASCAAQLENLQNIFSTNLLHHVPHKVAIEVRTTCLSAEAIERLLNLDESRFSKESLATTMKLMDHALHSGDMEKIRKAVALTNGAKTSLLRDLPESQRRQVSTDLKSLNDATKRMRVTEGTEYCVVSVITDHPKLLLMAGDLVQAASCQNYRSGSHIHTLPGYVIDGNIGLALSYVLKKGMLDNAGVKDYASLKFDPATQSLSVPGGAKQIPLGYAVRREVLRLGSSRGEAVCLTERPYLQTHAISNEIASHQRELVAAHLKRSGVRLTRNDETVTYPASRNPAGVYTDKGGGVKIGEYTLTPPESAPQLQHDVSPQIIL